MAEGRRFGIHLGQSESLKVFKWVTVISSGHIITVLVYALQLPWLIVQPDQLEARLVWGRVRALPASRPALPHHTAVGHMPQMWHTYALWLAPSSGSTIGLYYWGLLVQ